MELYSFIPYCTRPCKHTKQLKGSSDPKPIPRLDWIAVKEPKRKHPCCGNSLEVPKQQSNLVEMMSANNGEAAVWRVCKGRVSRCAGCLAKTTVLM